MSVSDTAGSGNSAVAAEQVASAENSLGQAASAYLRSARRQPIQWHEWGYEAFALAERERKPVLLDIGAVWCHWCHVMDRESYENPETAEIVNRHFVAVKVDRDERPDVDTRYQAAVAAISGTGGWPLTVFLTPDGRPFFGGTYFPPEDRYGRAGFRRVLLTMAGAFADQPDEVNETAASVMESLQLPENVAGDDEDPGRSLLDRMIGSCVTQFDPLHGGFGAQPKFPHSGALDLLLDAATRDNGSAQAAERIATFTLGRMAAGGIHDQLAGGFHRYSVDERWIVPHFEKMSYSNSELLKNYVHAFQSFAQPEFARVAHGIVRWMDDWLSDRERGGFYASQDADDSMDDDGDYFTWTRSEAREVLSEEEFRAAAVYFNLRDVGDMHGNPQKNVLHIKSSLDGVAQQLGAGEEAVRELLQRAQAKMGAARLQRRAPYIDRTMYTGWNGLCISAYLSAARVLRLPAAGEFALRSLDRVLDGAWKGRAGLARVVAYGEAPERFLARNVSAVLEDYAFLANAALDGWEMTGNMWYFRAADELAMSMMEYFQDAARGGFFDTARAEEGSRPIGVLATQQKPVQDSPTPSGNAVAATVLLRLHELTGRAVFREAAEGTLRCFAGVVEHLGLYAASYALALRRLVEPALQICIVGEDRAADEMELAALARFAENKSVVRLKREQLSSPETLPAMLAETLPKLTLAEGSFAVVCSGNACRMPVSTAEALLRMLVEGP